MRSAPPVLTDADRTGRSASRHCHGCRPGPLDHCAEPVHSGRCRLAAVAGGRLGALFGHHPAQCCVLRLDDRSLEGIGVVTGPNSRGASISLDSADAGQRDRHQLPAAIRRWLRPGLYADVFLVAASAAGLVAVLVTATILYIVLSKAADKIEVHGGVAVLDPQAVVVDAPSGESCHMSGIYDNVTAGTAVVISDGAGKTLTTTRLDGGVLDRMGDCVFPFTAEVTPGLQSYGVTVAYWATMTVSESDLPNAVVLLGG
jgi:hypothetical protein